MKTLSVILIATAIIVIFALTAYFAISYFGTITGNGNIKTKTYDVLSFKAIDIAGKFDVVLKQSDKESVTLIADENIINYVNIVSSDNVLQVKTTRLIKNFSNMQVFITFIDINSIEIKGAVNLLNKSLIKTDELELELDGAGTANLNIEARKLEVDINGAGKLEIIGNVDYNDIEISGAGIFKGKELITRKTDIDISGAAKAYVNASEMLDVKINGAGEVKYIGEPSVKQNITGAGKLIKEQ